MRYSLTILLSIVFYSAVAQWKVLPIVRPPAKQSARPQHNSASRTQDSTFIEPRLLPFWDDFSTSDSPYYPDTTKWYLEKSVSWNLGLGINPPSLGVVSFDGLDGLGKPYDVTNSLAKGYGDSLVSWTINMALVPANERDSVFFSMYYQFQGNGEKPDPGDHLNVDFRNHAGEWIPMIEINGDQVVKTDTFLTVSVAVADTSFFHDQFQFRIRSFGRQSGPWDNWNVDYVYLNRHRFAGDITFPDRTIYTPLTSLLGNYWSVPASHFHADSASLFVKPSFGITNLRQDQASPNGQPVSYNTIVRIEEWKAGTPTSAKTVRLDSAAAIIPALLANERRKVTLATIPAGAAFTTDSDSVRISLNALINSGDNIIDKLPPRDSGDYLAKFAPMDFRVNDATHSVHLLSSYYAYDDGSAEFAAGLNQSGTEMAYRFDMVTPNADNVLAVDLYFPNVGDLSSQTYQLIIRKDTGRTGVLYSETVSLERSNLNRYIRHKLNTNTVRVKGKFFVGWKQTSSVLIAVGLDESHDTSDRIYYYVNGTWLSQPPDVFGSLMIRPVMGTGGIPTGIDDEPIVLDIFPNPNTGSFYLSRQPDQLEVLDFTGRAVAFVQERTGSALRISLNNASPGIYLIRSAINGKMITRKIMVRGQDQ